MKEFKVIILLSVVLTSLMSCEKAFMKPVPSTDAKAIFDEYSTLVKEKYAMLEFKEVDIDFLIDSISPLVQNGESDAVLFEQLATITRKLKDGHSSLKANLEDTTLIGGFDILGGYPMGVYGPILVDSYLNTANNASIHTIPEGIEIPSDGVIKIVYGNLTQAPDLGYIYIPSFNVDITDDELETVFAYIKNTDGLILDVRLNGGGDPSLSTKLASYFMNTPTYTGFERFKVGPGANDFADSPSNVEPAQSSNRYFKPVVVLTDRGVYSATTTLCYNLDPLESITFMGQRTGGGSGSVADGFLANGWKWSLSTSEFIDYQGRHLDNGFEPDIAVALDTTIAQYDEVIEAAIDYLQ